MSKPGIPIDYPLDMQGYQVLNLVLQNLSSDPGSPSAGQVWFNTTSGQVKYYTGSATIVLYDAATTNTASKLVLRDGSGNFAANIGTFASVTISGTPTNATDAATKGYVDATATGLDVKAACRLATAAALPANTYSNGTAGVGATLTATGNGALSVDGTGVNASDRVLVKNEATGANNGIYSVTQAGSVSLPYILTRTTDFNTAALMLEGSFTFVGEGTANTGGGFVFTTAGGITVGTTALTFTQFSGAGEITPGNGLSKSGNTLTAVGVSGQIAVGGSGIGIDSSYAGQTSIVTVGTIATGTWAGTMIALAHGGTGATSASGAFNNLSPMTTLGDVIYGGASGAGTRLAGNTTSTREFLRSLGSGGAATAPVWDTLVAGDLPATAVLSFAATIGDGTSTSYVVNHNLGSRNVTVEVQNAASPFEVHRTYWEATDANNVTVYFGTAPASSSRVVTVRR